MRNSWQFACGSGLLASIMLLLSVGTASATSTTFNISGTAQNIFPVALGGCSSSSRCPFSGTLLINTTSGSVTGLVITFPGLSSFNFILASQASDADLSLCGSYFISSDCPEGPFWNVRAINIDGAFLSLFFGTNFPCCSPAYSLSGFNGGFLLPYPGFVYAANSGETTDYLYDEFFGSITPAPVPEPGSLGMMLFGLGVLGFFTLWARIRPRRQRAMDAG